MSGCAKATAILSLASLFCIAGCRTFQYHEPYLHLLQTDSTEITVHVLVRIEFSFANITGKPISGGCSPLLEKKIGDKWRRLPVNSLLETCYGVTFETGKIFHTEFVMLTSNILDDLSIGDPRGAKIDGIYRLRWTFVEGRDPQSTRARPVSGTSNEFALRYTAH
jgi:hypothetical protein